MSNWINHPTFLQGPTVDLVSLDKSHIPELLNLAKDNKIWEFYPIDGANPERLAIAYHDALLERDKGTQFPFVIYHRQDRKLVGSTRFLDIEQSQRKLGIGWTWLHPDYWGTGVNTECKLLLLTHSFEFLKASRVQIKTDENNIRSQKAIRKIGGQYEGILRNDMIRDNGTKRNSVYFSLIEEEWPEKKQNLTGLCNTLRIPDPQTTC